MATANPVSFTNLSGTLRLAAMITQEINLLLKDTGNLRNSRYMRYLGSINGMGSEVIRVRRAGLDGYNSMAAYNEQGAGNTISATALTNFAVDVTCARQGLMYEITDLGSMTSFGPEDVDPFRLAISMAGSYDARFAELTGAAAASGFTATAVGANTTQFSVDDFFNGIFELEKAASGVGVPGDYACVMAAKALTEFQDSLRNETSNAVAMAPSTADMLRAKGQNFAGTIMGVEVYRSKWVKENGSSGYDNFMFGQGGIGYCDGSPALVGASEMLQAGAVSVELERSGTTALTKVIGHAYVGVAVIDADRGIIINSAR
tara:strand:+ start:1011 stop:1964 length:954 start_codon:yes stop_codon:yes gene_type:complete